MRSTRDVRTSPDVEPTGKREREREREKDPERGRKKDTNRRAKAGENRHLGNAAPLRWLLAVKQVAPTRRWLSTAPVTVLIIHVYQRPKTRSTPLRSLPTKLHRWFSVSPVCYSRHPVQKTPNPPNQKYYNNINKERKEDLLTPNLSNGRPLPVFTPVANFQSSPSPQNWMFFCHFLLFFPLQLQPGIYPTN